MKVQDPDTFAAAPVAEAGGVESTTDSAFAAGEIAVIPQS
jgi:hypothetical protein